MPHLRPSTGYALKGERNKSRWRKILDPVLERLMETVQRRVNRYADEIQHEGSNSTPALANSMILHPLKAPEYAHASITKQKLRS